MTKQEAGIRGAEIKNASRYQILKELTKYFDRGMTEWFIKNWRTKQLQTLLEAKDQTWKKKF